jgi:hypothetical protein
MPPQGRDRRNPRTGTMGDILPSVTTDESFVVGDLGPNYGERGQDHSRYSSATGEMDSPYNKGLGFFGDMAVKGANGESGGMTEFSRTDYLPDGGDELVDYPLVVPTLSESQLRYLVEEGWKKDEQGKPAKIPEEIEIVARNHAQQRINAGKSPFATPDEANWNRFPNIARRPRPVAIPDTRTFTQTFPE